MPQVSSWGLVRECPSQLAQFEMAVPGGWATQFLPKSVVGIIDDRAFVRTRGAPAPFGFAGIPASDSIQNQGYHLGSSSLRATECQGVEMQIGKIETRGAIKIQNLVEAVAAFTAAGERGLDRAQLAEKLGKASHKTADRAREALARQGAIFHELPPNANRRTPYVMDQGPTWAVPVNSAIRLSFSAALDLLSRSGATVLAEQLLPIYKMAEDSMANQGQAGSSHGLEALSVQGGFNADPTKAEVEACQKLLEAFGKPVRPLVSLRLVGSAQNLVVHPQALILDSDSSELYFLGLKAGGEPELAFHRLAELEQVSLLDRPSILPSRTPDSWEELLNRARTYQMKGKASLEEPFLVQLRISDPNLKKRWEETPPDLPDFDLKGRSVVGSLVEKRAPVFKANQVDAVAEWVLSFGGKVEAVHPPALVQRVGELAQKIANAHGMRRIGG
jgi:hypothetical protein